MRCIVTVGPTYEPLDDVRRLTNFSTGRLGSELASFLTARGHETTLLIGELASYKGPREATVIEGFTTTNDLLNRLRIFSAKAVDAVFHAAAVSDFGFGKIWVRSPQGDLSEIRSGKLSTRQGTLLAELVPTVKIITELRNLFPKAFLVGWKYEVDGDQSRVIGLARQQIEQSRTNACVANGPAYGPGFGLVHNDRCQQLPEVADLFRELEKLTRREV